MAIKDKSSSIFHSWPFSAINYIFFVIGILLIIIGYILMATGETSSTQTLVISPIILIIGYCVVIPLSIILK